jgi:transcriptional regulator with XRE-family HTH domain
MSLAKNLSQNLFATRTQRKLSQAAVAKAAGMSVSYVSMLERGQRSGVGLIRFGRQFDYATNRELTYPQKLDRNSL